MRLRNGLGRLSEGRRALIQRRQWHKRENVVTYLPKSTQALLRRKLQEDYQVGCQKNLIHINLRQGRGISKNISTR